MTQDLHQTLGELSSAGWSERVQVFAGLMLVQRIEAGPFIVITVSSALIAWLVIDHFGCFRMNVHPVTVARFAGLTLLIGGVFLITKG